MYQLLRSALHPTGAVFFRACCRSISSHSSSSFDSGFPNTSRIDALPLEQFLHGPLVTVNADDLAILIDVRGANPTSAARTSEVARVLDRIGARIWLVGQGVSTVPGATVFELPELNELISPILAVVPMQIFAYQVAVEKGSNPDLFRRDDPRYADALSTITL